MLSAPSKAAYSLFAVEGDPHVPRRTERHIPLLVPHAPSPPELLRRGEGREAARRFRDAASRARRGRDAGGGGGGEAIVALARNLRMEGVAVAMAGDRSSAELLLRASLRELRVGDGDGGGVDLARGGGEAREEEALALAALGSLLAQEG